MPLDVDSVQVGFYPCLCLEGDIWYIIVPIASDEHNSTVGSEEEDKRENRNDKQGNTWSSIFDLGQILRPAVIFRCGERPRGPT